MHRRWMVGFGVLGILLFAAITVLAQENMGRIVGNLFDPSGAAVVGAKLHLTNAVTRQRQERVSGTNGNYSFEDLPEGNYTLTVEASGFQKLIRETILVKPSLEAVVNLTLSVPTRQETVTVSEEGYAVPTATGGTKSDASLLETPMAVQVIPREVIDDRQQRTALEAVQSVSGVTPSQYEFYDQFFIRGFDSGYGATFRNGLQMRGITEAVNMAFVDHIEVVKGPSSMLYGRIEPGGFVNVVTEKPEPVSSYTFEQQAGSWGMFRTTVGATGSLHRDRRLTYRLTGDYDKAGSWVENAHRNNKAGAATLAWHPNTKFNGNVQYEQYKYKMAWLDAGIPVVGDRPLDLPRNFTILYPQSWSAYPYNVRRSLLASNEWSYVLSGTWKIANRYHYVHSKEDQEGVYLDSFGGFDGLNSYTATRFTHNPGWIRNTQGINLDLSGEFRTGPIRHKILVGFDWAKFADDTPGSTGDIVGAAPVNVYHPVYPDYSATLASLAASDASNILWRDRSNDMGVYFQDQITLGGKWDLLVGGRYDAATDGYSDTYGTRDSACYPHCTGLPVSSYPTDRAFSPRAGLLYRVTSNASAYFSYSKSFGDSNGRDNNGNQLKPQIGTQYEAGLKASLMSGRMTGSITFFNLTKTNIPEYDPINFFPHIVGAARSRGLELDVAGQLTKRLSLIGAYTFDKAIITEDPYNNTQGNRLSGVAPHVGSVWVKYDHSPGAVKGWTLGAGAYASAQRQGSDAQGFDSNTWQLPGFGRIDAMAGYRFGGERARLSLQLNVSNLFDKKYFDHGGYGVAAYGAPRSITVATKLRF